MILYICPGQRGQKLRENRQSRACHLNSKSSLQCITSKVFVSLILAGEEHKGGSLFASDKCAFICCGPLMYRETLAGIFLPDKCSRNPTPSYYP